MADKTSYPSEHRRLRPVLELARRLDVATNPAPEAVFAPGNAGFDVHVTEQDKPTRGWEGVPITQGAYAKPANYLASVVWGWEDTEHGPAVTHLVLSTQAYSAHDHFGGASRAYANRRADTAWAERKIRWLFEQAGVNCPPINVK